MPDNSFLDRHTEYNTFRVPLGFSLLYCTRFGGSGIPFHAKYFLAGYR
jgi:hypothetical protein